MILLSVSLAAFACTSEVDDAFDDQSAIRISQAIEMDNALLLDAPNGWLVEFYAASEYGGYNVICKFHDDNTVTVMNELFLQDDATIPTKTTHYSIGQSQGVILSFDEYNDYFHCFSEPSNIFGIGSAGRGMMGDCEFRVLSATQDEFVIKGKKRGSKIVMTRIADGVDWIEYLSAAAEKEADMTRAMYKLVTPDTTLVLSRNYRNFSYALPDGSTTSVPYVYTPDGIKLRTPLDIKGKEIESFAYNDSADEIWPSSNDNAVYLQPYYSLALVFQSSDWYVSGEGCSQDVLAALGAIQSGCSGYGGLSEFWFGQAIRSDMTGRWGFSIYTGTYVGCWELIPEVVSPNEITLSLGKVGGNAGVFARSGAFGTLYNILTDTFTITADNPRNPSYLVLTGQNSGAEFTLYPDECLVEL